MYRVRIIIFSIEFVGEQLLSYVWENLKKIFAASTTARKLQLRQELSNVRQHDLSVADCTSKIKDICDSLASIDVNVEEEEMVQICLGAYMTRVAKVREPESYAEAAKDVNWCAAIEEEMRVVV